MKKSALFVFCLTLLTGVYAQSTLSLTFVGQDQSHSYIQLDSVQISNMTRGWSQTIFYPDTELVLDVSVGVENYYMDRCVQISPNPFDGRAILIVENFYEKQSARFSVTDVQGRLCAESYGYVGEGTDIFTVTLTQPQIYFFTIQTDRFRLSWKLVNIGHGGSNRIDFVEHRESLDASGEYNTKGLRFVSDSTFVLGDEMRYVGYATIDGEMQVSEPVLKAQMADDTVGLVFYRDGIPCSNMPTVVDHEGNVYHTVQMGPQCWTAESMRATTSPSTGTSIVSSSSTSNTYSGKMAKWYNHDTTYAAMNYGLLYNWNAAMDTFNMDLGEVSIDANNANAVSVSLSENRRGVCPEGWHVPSNAEWNALVNYVKTKEEYQCGNVPTKVAKAFASTVGWASNSTACNVGNDMGSNNATGFCAFPAGFMGNSGFSSVTSSATFWTASQNSSNTASTWSLYYNNAGMYPSSNGNKSYLYSVRCIRD